MRRPAPRSQVRAVGYAGLGRGDAATLVIVGARYAPYYLMPMYHSRTLCT